MRDRVAAIIATRLLKRLETERALDWTPQVRIRREGLDVATPQGTWRVIPWDLVATIAIDGPQCRISFRNNASSEIKLSAVQPNLHAMLSVANTLRRGRT